jgi:hypothetical protein
LQKKYTLFLNFLVNQLNVSDLLVGYWEFPRFLKNNVKAFFFLWKKRCKQWITDYKRKDTRILQGAL